MGVSPIKTLKIGDFLISNKFLILKNLSNLFSYFSYKFDGIKYWIDKIDFFCNSFVNIEIKKEELKTENIL